MTADERDKATKHDFIDKCVAYKTLLRVIDAQEKFTYLKRELSLFLVFMLVFFLYVGLSRHISESYQMQRAVLSNLAEKRFPASPEPNELDYITFYGINDKTTMFQWLSVVFASNLIDGAVTNNGKFLGWNELLWGVRFRQLRVDLNADCQVPEAIQQANFTDNTCAIDYSTVTQSITPYGPSTTRTVNNVTVLDYSFTWSDAQTTDASDVSGTFADYDGSGFVVDYLLTNATYNDTVTSLDTFQTLLDTLDSYYVDSQTRAVFITFSLYNVNFNLFGFCNFLIEFSPTGLADASLEFRAAPLLPGTNSDPGAFVLLLNYILVVFIIFYMYKIVVKELRYLRRIQPFWLALDITSVVLLGFHLVHLVRYDWFKQGQSNLKTALLSHEFYSIDVLTDWYETLQEVYAVNMILICIRVFKYLKLSSGLAKVWKTMARAVRDILFFLGLFSIIFIGFALCAFLVYGPHLDTYVTFGSATSTLLRMVIGEIDYAPLRQINPTFSWIFFLCYVSLFVFILTNIFLAIILDAWNIEAEEERQHAEPIDLVEEVKDQLGVWWEKFKKGYRKRRYWRAEWRALRNAIKPSRRNVGFMSDEMVLSRLQEWKKKRQNKGLKFMTITALQHALEGIPKEREIPEDQLVDIFWRVRSHLLPREVIQQMESDDQPGHDADEEARDMNLSELKKLQAAFTLLAENQRRHMDAITEKIESLASMQMQSGNKLDFLDGQIKKIVPHFADV